MNLSRVIDAISLARDPEQASGELSEVLSRVHDLKDYYPQFDTWLSNKVVPGIALGERTILTESRDGVLAALAIVKDDGFEKKLCCLRVLPGFQNMNGMGVRLFERCFEVLGTTKPVLSVAEERLPQFTRIFHHFDFEAASQYHGLYRPGKAEHAFNGLLIDRTSHLAAAKHRSV